MISITLSIKEARMLHAAVAQEISRASGTSLAGRDLLSLSRIQGDLALQVACAQATVNMGVK
jgi:hypothetical protein